MSSKIKILIYLVSFLVTIVIIKFSFNEKELLNFALGKNTSTYFATDKNKNPIHVSNIDSLAKSTILKTWKSNGGKDVALVLGNSQTHSINQMQDNEFNYLEILDKDLISLQIVGNTNPNASIQDFLISYFYWKDLLPIKHVFIPLFFDDTREVNGINYDFYPQLVNENFRFPLDSDLFKNFNNSLNLMKESSNESSNTGLSTQDRSELLLNDFLYSNWNSVWGKRKDAQGFIFSKLYLLRNFIFNINPSSTRRKIPERYFNNMLALDLMIKDAISSNVNLFLYIPPIRDDAKIPYNLDDYYLFINEVRVKSEKSNFVYFKDFSSIVPSSFFGTKDATSLTSKNKELDFMHFQFKGHEILGDSLVKYYLNSTK